jgi:uncharacterized protein YcbX
MDTLKVPLAAERATLDDVSVWEWSGSAYDEGAEAAEWFSTYFGKPARLVRFKEGAYIPCGAFKVHKTSLTYVKSLFSYVWQSPKSDQLIQTMLKVTRSHLLMPSRS